MIIFGECILFISSIFENYSKRIIEIFKNQPKELRHKVKKKIYREKFKENINEFYDLIEINFLKFYRYLYSIADNLKHSDWKFYKRFNQYTCFDFLKEANELYLELKLYIKESLFTFSLLQVRLNYPEHLF